MTPAAAPAPAIDGQGEGRLVYFADPMCSWCYGFGPEIDAFLADRPGVRVTLVMGGLRPYTREAATEAFRETIRGHWAHVAKASGLPFDDTALAREGFVYDTEPACRAVVTVRALAPGRALDYLHGVQAAFYAHGRDTTDAAVLADVAVASGIDRDAFLERHGSAHAKEETRTDFATTQSMGVQGFPTVALAMTESRLLQVSAGFLRADDLAQRYAQALELAMVEDGPG